MAKIFLIQPPVTPNELFARGSNTKEVGIPIRGYFMLGLPTETREDADVCHS